MLKTSEWEKIIANETTDRGLVSNIYKQCTQLNIRKTNSPIKKCAEDLNKHFSKEGVHMANKHMKRCSTSLIIREMKIKTVTRYQLSQVSMPSSKNQQTINAGRLWRKRKLLALLMGMWIDTATMENSM